MYKLVRSIFNVWIFATSNTVGCIELLKKHRVGKFNQMMIDDCLIMFLTFIKHFGKELTNICRSSSILHM